MRRYLSVLVLVVTIVLFAIYASGILTVQATDGPNARPVKVLIITMFEFAGPFAGETQRWIEGLGLTEEIPVPGLPPAFPNVNCNDENVCVITTDIGYANAASSVSAVMYSGKFNLSQTYFLVAGIAGVDPADGTLGSAAWARFAIDGDLSHEIDAREMPSHWPYGYTGFGPVEPGVVPSRKIGNEVFRLNAALVQRAFDLTQNVVLSDGAAAQAYRANYPNAPANQPPAVIMCDTFSDDTYWHGSILSQRANDWAKLLTNNEANYCMTQEEDNSTLTALKRGANAGLLDFNRIAILRTASNFDQQYPGQTAFASLKGPSGGFIPSLTNAYRVGSVFVLEIANNWGQWKDGIPAASPQTAPTFQPPN